MFFRASLYLRWEENQLVATECFIAFIICSTCFRHLYAHHQELETILVLLPHMVCNALVDGGRRSGAGQQAMRPGWGRLCNSHNFPHPGRIACCSARNSRPSATKALHTICDNNTSIVSSSWWWAYKCPKHVEQIINSIKHSVATSWFSSQRKYNDARKNIYQIHEKFCISKHIWPKQFRVRECWPAIQDFHYTTQRKSWTSLGWVAFTSLFEAS